MKGEKQMGAKFVGNIGKKRLHVLAYADGRFHINQIRSEQRVEFDTLEEAQQYPKGESPIFHECGICFPKMRKARK